MKELSIEEKAKRYDEAIKRAKNTIEVNQAIPDIVECVESLFPELHESEDERIRKELIEHIKANCETGFILFQKFSPDKIIAWLEKQGEPKSYWKPSKEEMDALYGLAYITNKMDDKKDEAITKLYQDLKKEFFSGVSYENMFPSSPVDAPIKLEKQGEQKLADKVEPKFHEGEWIVYENGSTYYINKVYEHTYELIIDNGDRPKVYFDIIDNISHTWTIQDAKVGDVLVHNDCVFIFMGIKRGIVQALEENLLDGTNPVPFGDKDYHPATKEQCNTLFARMKEAGYEWDAKHKQLKKIEQKPVIKMKTPEESLGIDSDTYNKIVDECVYGEQKPAWSEEDESKLKSILFHIEDVENKDVIDWFKSLKDRYAWKPSDEQMEALDRAQAELCSTEYNKPICDLIDALNKLKE